MRSYLFFCCLAVVFLMSAPAVLAADADAGRFSSVVSVVDPVTLKAQGLRITLWGIKPVSESETPIKLKAINLMEDMIGSAAVNCKILSGAAPDVVARCTVHSGEDMGLELLNHGYVVVDRQQDVDSVPAYMQAQKAAQQNVEGIWRQVMTDEGDSSSLPWLQILLEAIPLAGVLLVAFMLHYRLKRLEALQVEEHEQAKHKESRLLTRERYVLASTLEGELTENKNRIEAFLTVYGAMLENLKSKTETPKYQQSGDIVQKHPSLSKMAFETSAGKFALLDMKLAAQLSKLYAALPKEQEYVNIEPGVPLESAVALVEKVMREAEALAPPITAAITALEEVVASSRKLEA